jgi:hypothetical protein
MQHKTKTFYLLKLENLDVLVLLVADFLIAYHTYICSPALYYSVEFSQLSAANRLVIFVVYLSILLRKIWQKQEA